MEYFLSCDWGTTAFRLRLVERNSLRVIEALESDEGCAIVHQQWLDNGRDHQRREDYFLRILARNIEQLENQAGESLAEIPVVISGMASSSAGMIELPYKNLPFKADGSDLIVHRIASSEILKNSILLISGVCTNDDVMRGEETKLIGLLSGGSEQNTTLILPGTHPKHVYIENGQVAGFKTFMTGEFFALLSRKSLLAMSVSENESVDEVSFLEGLKEGTEGNLLHSTFSVRVNALFEKYTLEQNYHYLSGLLIGTELKDLADCQFPISLLGNESAGSIYSTAMKLLNIPLERRLDADEFLIRGQAEVLKWHA